MKLKTFSQYSVSHRIMIFINAVLVVVLIGGTILLNAYVKDKMKATYIDSVHTLFTSFQEGVKGSLERGQMKNFKTLLMQQHEIKGILDASLYDRNGKINLSSSDAIEKDTTLPEEIQLSLNEKKTFEEINSKTIRIVSPQVVITDCVRCHLTWRVGEIGGSLSLTYDLSPLTSTINRLQWMLAIGSLLLLFITSGCIYTFMLRTVTKPITHIIDGLTASATMLSEVASQAAASSQSMAERASQQAASLEETSASIEEISAMTLQNADNSGSANVLMSDTRKVMTDANQAMDQLSQAMQGIAQANNETSKIIKTIDEIAFQTNLLALNAAVEAARAGEVGAGFAVVANEVRSLAMRAAESARNTAQLLEGTSAKVNNGVQLVQLTDKSFKQAVEQAEKTSSILQEITTASKEQSLGIRQVSTAVQELDDATQQNAADADKDSHLAANMEQQSQHLNDYIQKLASLISGENHPQS
ncbi:MAG: methyl-accepting chemotaxis protein [Proteobacteria bacterium]|nr:methyl-accepting chemotaxis protein [Desulfobulbaceae bacterium]MBU4153503.1 methyl-accepting chemotaxis protein [Pseudomonadota bacterium]MDP2107408.1 methyl-accepting chemotaxis protein [Desulfobulbaceae bacterium]